MLLGFQGMGWYAAPRCKPHVNKYPLLLLLIALILQFRTSQCRSVLSEGQINLQRHVDRDKEDPNKGVLPVQRVHKLVHACTHKTVRIMEKKIVANGTTTSTDANLLLQSVSFDRVTIQSNNTKMFLCFNKKGKLFLRHTGRRHKRCHFVEKPAGHMGQHMEYQSSFNPQWKLGFRKYSKKAPQKTGLPLYKKYHKMQSCYQFSKVDVSEEPHKLRHASGYQPVPHVSMQVWFYNSSRTDNLLNRNSR